MTDLLPQNVFPVGLGFSEDQLNDAMYMAYRGARTLGYGGHGPRVLDTRWDLDAPHGRIVIRWDLDAPHGRIVIRCVIVVKENHYRLRYAPTLNRRRSSETFDEDRGRLELLVRDVLEARAIRFDTLYVGIAMGER